MARLVVKKENFPDADIFTEEIRFRFRIITDDRNVASYWSPIYSVNPEYIYVNGNRQIPGVISLEKNTGYVTAVWDSVAIYKNIEGTDTLLSELPFYDVWIKFASNGGGNPGPWLYKERISATSLNIQIPSSYEYSSGLYDTPKEMYVEIYRPGRPIQRYEKINISVTQNSTNVDLSNDTFTFASDHGFVTGDMIVYSAASPALPLQNDQTYWVKSESSTSISLFNNKNDALDNVNKIDITSTGSGSATFSLYPFLLYKTAVTTL